MKEFSEPHMTTKSPPPRQSKARAGAARAVQSEQGLRVEPSLTEGHPITLVDQIYNWLESKIVTLDLPPGALLSELVIGREFGVSRTPVGEALQRLAQERLVTILPRRGFVVTEISVSEQLRLIEFRREIARFIARHGAKRANEEERTALRRVANGFLRAAAKNDEAGLLAADKEFHDLFASSAHNNFAASAIGPLDSLSRRFFYMHRYVVGNTQLSAKLHSDIAMAMADGDAQAAEDATDAMADYLDEFARSTLDQPLALVARPTRA
jgi:DNA-binding GntR family transcriptional regulator